MKRPRRICVEIERRETSIWLTLREPRAADPPRPFHDAIDTPNDGLSESARDSRAVPATCPVCGSSWIRVPNAGQLFAGPHLDRLLSAFVQLGLHSPVFMAGRLFVCRQSFEKLREKRR